jgi:L-ascorbate metabolism protein UlaG (beta-lactamase superfamily)
MRITWFGHSAFRVEAGKDIILIDPFLTGNPSFPGNAEDAARGATHVVLTHGHDDHLGDSAAILKRTGAQLVANFEICMFLASQGIENINPGNSGGTVPCGDFTVSFTQALHSSGTVVDGRSVYLGNPHGIIVAHQAAPVLYHMGDTDIFGDMALIEEFYAPKIGIVPIGDRFTMSPARAALAVKRYFHFEHVIPCHYATFPVLAPNADGFVAGLKGHATRVVVPKPGAPFDL